jgi:hypothetical protein
MPVNSAPARSAFRSPIARVLACSNLPVPANDDATAEGERTLDAALRHFALHGLGSARAAYREAEHALAVGDLPAAAGWLAVCRTFDKRLAATLAERIAPANPAFRSVF